MCLQCAPENDHGCCRLQMTLSRHYVGGTIPRVYVRRIDFQLYAVWTERGGRLIAQCIEACCQVNAKASFIGTYLITDEGEVELNRMYALPDKRLSAHPDRIVARVHD
jgi:hypothetical protein